MSSDPLRIGVNVDVSQLQNLADASQQVAASVGSMSEQFVATGLTAKEIAEATQNMATQLVAATGGIQQQATDILNLREALSSTKSALAETADIIREEGGAANTSASIMRQYAIETAQVAVIQRLITQATDAAKTSLAGLVATQAGATAASAENAAASSVAAGATAANAAQVERAAVAFSQETEQALATGQAIIEGSTAAQTATQRYLTLSSQLSALRSSMAESKAAATEVGVSQDVAAQAANQYAAQLTSLQLIQQQVTAAEADMKAAISDSYIAVQTAAKARADAATQEAAALAVSQEAHAGAVDAAMQLIAAESLGIDVEAEAAKQTETLAAAQKIGAEAAIQDAGAQRQRTQVLATAGDMARLAATQATAMAKSLLASGSSAKDTASMLQNLNFSAEAVAAALKAAGASAEGFGAKTAAAGGEAQIAAGKVDQMTKALAYSGVRLASNELGVGQLGFALARIGAISQTLAPVLAAAFPVLAIFAFIQVAEQVTKTMQAWEDQAQKSADEQAKWTREIDKSAESVDKMREKLAGTISPLAALAEEMANADNKVLDVSSTVEMLNKRLEDGPSLWKSLKQGIGDVASGAFNLFNDAAEDAQVEGAKLDRQISDNIKTFKDLPAAIQDVQQHIRALKEEMANVNLAAWTPELEANFSRQISLWEGFRTTLTNTNEAHNLQMLSEQQSIDEKLLSEQERVGRARISYEEAQTSALTRLHQGTLQDELSARITEANELDRVEKASIEKRISNLRTFAEQEKKAGSTADFTNAFKALEEQKSAISTETEKKIFEATASFNEKSTANTIAAANAEIAARLRVAEATLKETEASEKFTFSRADTPAAIEAAAIPLIQTTTRLYQEQAQAKRDVVQAELDALKAAAPTAKTPTAEPGTDAFGEQLKSIESIAPEIYAKALDLNSQLIALRHQQATAIGAIEDEQANKTRQFYAADLNNRISSLNDMLVDEKTKYQEGSAALDAHLNVNKAHWAQHFAELKGLAEQNYREQIAILSQESDAVRAAVEIHTITEQQGSTKLNEIWKREEEVFKEMMKREEQTAKQAVEKEEADIKTLTEKITQDFTQSFNQVVTGHEKVGQAAVKLGAELELYIIDQGIKRVATHYLTELLTMVAGESTTVAKILGIHVVNTAQLNALMAQQTAAHNLQLLQRETLDITDEAKQRSMQAAQLATFTTNQTTQTTEFTTSQAAQTTALTTAQTTQTAAVTAGVAAQKAAITAAAISIITTMAAEAAAGGFANAMIAVPFPEDLAVAPATAAAAFAQVEAFAGAAVFEQGGIVRANLHEGEMVLPKHISTFVQTAAAGAAGGLGGPGGPGGPGGAGGAAGDTYRTQHNHVRIEMHNHGGSMTQDDVVAAVKRGLRSGSLP